MRRRPVFPAARAAVFAAVCVCLAAGAHLWMSGAPIPLGAVLTGFAAVYVAARLGAGRERSLGAIVVLMGVAQTGLHLLFTAAQQAAAAQSAASSAVVAPAAVIVQLPSVPLPGTTAASAAAAAVASMGAMPGMPGMSSGGAGTLGAMPSMTGSSMPGGMQMTTGMLAAHAVAALVCAWWLRRGEAALHTLVRTAARWVRRRVALPPLTAAPLVPADPPRLRPAVTRPVRPRPRFVGPAALKRGPPDRLSL